MVKEKDKIRQSTLEDEENIAKIVSPEGEFEIPIGDGKRKKVFWARTGYKDRVYFKAYFKKRLKEAIDTGLVGIDGHYKGKAVGKVDGKNIMFGFEPNSLDEKTLKVYIGSAQKKLGIDYNYSSDLRALFFMKAPSTKDVIVEYDHYDLEIYNQLFNDSFVITLIFLCARDPEDEKKQKRIFKSVDDIGILSTPEVNEIMSLYAETKPFGQLEPERDNLKNSHTPPLSSDGGDTPKDGILIPGEEQSGDKKQQTTKSTD